MKGRPRLALVTALLTLAPLTAGCGAGLNAETLREGSTIDGANAQTGDLRIRNGFLAAPQQSIQFPAGSDIPIYVSVSNIGDQADTLTEVTSPLGQVVVQPGPTASSQPSASATASPASPSPASPSPTSPSPAAGSQPVELPVGQTISFGGGSGPSMVLRQVSKPVRVASFVPITLRFEQSDEVTIQAPVGSGYGPGAGPTSSETPTDSSTSEESGSHESGTHSAPETGASEGADLSPTVDEPSPSGS